MLTSSIVTFFTNAPLSAVSPETWREPEEISFGSGDF